MQQVVIIVSDVETLGVEKLVVLNWLSSGKKKVFTYGNVEFPDLNLPGKGSTLQQRSTPLARSISHIPARPEVTMGGHDGGWLRFATAFHIKFCRSVQFE